MRIITGDFKGRKLETPMNNRIRPTSDKVKEAIFSMIVSSVEGATCVDLFSGTGNLGLEALSRGADLCYFGDNSREALAIIKRNISRCKAEDWSILMAGDFERTLDRLGAKEEKVDIFFLDPPYHEHLYEKCFQLIRDYELLSTDGIILAEHDSRDQFPDQLFGFEKIKEKTYGSIGVTLYG